jgi:hypothetical protein
MKNNNSIYVVCDKKSYLPIIYGGKVTIFTSKQEAYNKFFQNHSILEYIPKNKQDIFKYKRKQRKPLVLKIGDKALCGFCHEGEVEVTILYAKIEENRSYFIVKERPEEGWIHEINFTKIIK